MLQNNELIIIVNFFVLTKFKSLKNLTTSVVGYPFIYFKINEEIWKNGES
jgi:hypothetical protein